MNLDDVAAQQLRDYDSKEIGTIFNDAQFTLAQAYAIQSKVSTLREQRGEPVIGYKVGCVSPALRASMGISHPVFGRLFETELWQSGVQLNPDQFAKPAIEGELAVRLNRVLRINDQNLSTAIDSAYVVIEMHNKVFRGAPGAPELVANNAIHAGVIQTRKKASKVAEVPGPLSVIINQTKVASVEGADLRSTIFNSLHWLTEALHQQGYTLMAGQTVLCGTISGMHAVDVGAHVQVTTEDFGSVNMRFG